MSNNANRTLIVLVAAAIIVLMALLIFVTWRASADIIDNIGDLSEYLADHNDDAGKLIITLCALIVMVLALLVIVVELAPEDEEKELRVKQAGATTIVPAAALRQRIEEALRGLPDVTAAKAKVSSRDKGIASEVDLTVVPGANISAVTSDSIRVVNDTIESDLGLPVAGAPTVRVGFGGAKAAPVASSVSREPGPEAASTETAPAQQEAAPGATEPATAAGEAAEGTVVPAAAAHGERAPEAEPPADGGHGPETEPAPPDAEPPAAEADPRAPWRQP